MKQKFLNLMLVCSCLFGFGVGKVLAVDVTFISDEFSTKTTAVYAAERNLGQVLTEINRAQMSHDAVNVGRLNMNEFAKRSLARIWAVTPFICDCDDNEFIASRGDWQIFKNGTIMVRHIPLLIKPVGETFGLDDCQEAIAEFDKNGMITDFRFAIRSQQGLDFDRCGTEDVEIEHIIKRQLEQFRTAYCQKDAKTIEDMFSDDALIITGRVVQRRINNEMFPTQTKVEYTRQTKQQYINNLKKAFARNKWIDVKFDIPSGNSPCHWIDRTTKKDSNGNPLPFYGVRLIQTWKSSNYSDKGYLFLLWEFPENGGDPIIHVRTWQPENVNGVHRDPDDDISTLGGFNL